MSVRIRRPRAFYEEPEDRLSSVRLMTLDEIAARFGVTRRAVMVSEQRALRKLWRLAEDPEVAAMLQALRCAAVRRS